MLLATNCVPPVAPVQCVPAAPSAVGPAAPGPTSLPAAVPAATAAPTVPGASAAPAPQSASEDPVALLSEAVDQLRLALIALKRSPSGEESHERAPQAQGADARITALAREIGESQNEIGALLASRRYYVPSSSPYPTPSPNLAPFGDAAFSDAGGLFAEQTAEPSF